MTDRTLSGIGPALALSLAVTATGTPLAPRGKESGEASVQHAAGTFEVKLTPQAADDKSEGLGRLTLEKQIHGDLEGVSRGQMLSVGPDDKGSGAYVAIERVTGSLKGRTGTFVLQHSGTLTRGTHLLSVSVVPDSGTGQLLGLTGRMDIKIADGKHSYDFEYRLPDVP